MNDSRIVYIYNDCNLGFGQANNVGVNIAQGRNLIFLNPDTVLINNAIKILSDYLDSHESAGACGGNLYDESMQPAHSYSMLLPSIEWELNLLTKGCYEKLRWGRNHQFNFTHHPMRVGYICGADLMIRKELLPRIGGAFSPYFFMYYEDTELSYRIKKAGYDVVSIPDAKIQHLEGKSMTGKSFNCTKIRYVETGLSKFYSLHTSKATKVVTKVIRLLRMSIKRYIYYPNMFNQELYKECIDIIFEKENKSVGK